jgi:hypothetical protein
MKRARDIRLDNGRERLDAPCLANVGMLREPIGRAHDIWPQQELGRAAPRAGRRRLGLQPIKKTKARAFRVL